MTEVVVAQQSEAPEPPKHDKLKLEIVAGVHRGAVLLLDRGDYRIGSSPAADIVLSDPGIVAEHATLRIERGAVHLAAIGADITVGQELLPLSRGCCVGLPVSFSLGTAQIHLSDPAPGDAGRSLRLSLVVVGTLAGVGFAVTLTAGEFTEVIGHELMAESGMTERCLASFAAASSSTAGVRSRPGSVVQDAINALKSRLDAANIRTLQISAENGRLVATGTLAGQAVTEWAAIQQWFDKTYGGSIVLASKTTPPGPRTMPAMQLQAVWYGERPYILTVGGEHYFNGAILNDGWVIRDIGEDRLLLAKDGETVSLTYR